MRTTLEEVLDHYDGFFRRVARTSSPPNLPPIISSNGQVVDRGFVRPEERAALLAYLRKLWESREGCGGLPGLPTADHGKAPGWAWGSLCDETVRSAHPRAQYQTSGPGSVMLAIREIRAINNDGVYAVAATIKQLYEMIEFEDERMHRLVAAANAAHLHKIEQLTARIARLENELAGKVRQVHHLNLAVRELNKQLKEARRQTRQAREAHLAHLLKDSRNSSMPPSQDRRKRTRSLRERSGRKPGGQVGHRGTTLGFVDQPDRLIIHAPADCYLCGSPLGGSEVTRTERRQVHELPPRKIEVTEHQAQRKVCGRCGAENKAEFPAGVKAPVQYGAGVKSVAAYLLGYQLLPYERCAEALNDLFNCHLSSGTLATLLKGCAGELVGAEMLIKEGLGVSAALGVDETNLRVSRRQDWIHVSSTDKLTLLVVLDVLVRHRGIVVSAAILADEPSLIGRELITVVPLASESLDDLLELPIRAHLTGRRLHRVCALDLSLHALDQRHLAEVRRVRRLCLGISR